MPQNVKISLAGITRHTSHLNAADGESATLINLTLQNGTLHPIPVQQPIYTLTSGRKLIYIHRNASYENWLTYDGNTLFFEAVEDSTTISPATRQTAIYAITGLHKIESIGNILILFSDKKEYILFKDGQYHYLGERPPFPEIVFSLYGGASCPERWCDIDPPMADAFSYFDATNKNRVTDTVIGAINEELNYTKNVGRFSFPFFVRYALRLFDDSIAYHSAPVLLMPSEDLYVHITRSQNHDKKFTDFFYQIHKAEVTLHYDLSAYDISKWSDIVKSIDIFISEQIPRFNQNGEIPRIINNNGDWFLELPKYSDAEFKTKLEENALFYLVYSIKLKQGINTSSGDIVPESKIMQNLVFQEQATDDFNSHCTLQPGCSYVYNSKLHIANIRQTLFPGFAPFHKTDSTIPLPLLSVDTYTSIKTDTGDAIVHRHDEMANARAYLNPYLYYPDSRAFQMVIVWHTTNGLFKKTITLTPHKFLNGAYALLSHIQNDVPFDGTPGNVDSGTKNNYQYYPNKIQVSELNNPFTFPANQIYTIGNGQIIGMAAATTALSAGQFGQFPLYTFTDEGIWASETGGSAYSSQHPVTRDVCNNPDSITQIDNAIIFATDKGVMLLSGSSTVYISMQLDGSVFELDALPQLSALIDNSDTVQVAHAISPLHFISYLKKSRIGYNYTLNQIIISNTDPAVNYIYIYSLQQKQWNIQARNYLYMLNSYPYLYTTDTENNIYNLSRPPRPEEVITATPVLLVTRPLKIIPDTYKRIVNLILRSNQQRIDGRQYITLLYGSNDTETWTLVAGSQETSRTPLRPITPHGSPFKYYIVVYLGSLLPTSSISHIDILIDTDYTDKLR